jgi:hypothetical protein
MNQEVTPEIEKFYLELIRDTSQGIQKKVCEANEISLEPTSASQLCPIPVYEENSKLNLLTSANIRRTTTIQWATNQNFTYLPAYFKKFKRDGRTCNEVVVIADNYCIARFFAAKELMHCFLDDDGYAATNSIALVNELIESLAVGTSNIQNPPRQTIVDEIAWLGAAEYLVPSSWVPLLIKTRDNISEQLPKSNAYKHLAQLIRVPETVLRNRLRLVKP